MLPPLAHIRTQCDLPRGFLKSICCQSYDMYDHESIGAGGEPRFSLPGLVDKKVAHIHGGGAPAQAAHAGWLLAYSRTDSV